MDVTEVVTLDALSNQEHDGGGLSSNSRSESNTIAHTISTSRGCPVREAGEERRAGRRADPDVDRNYPNSHASLMSFKRQSAALAYATCAMLFFISVTVTWVCSQIGSLSNLFLALFVSYRDCT